MASSAPPACRPDSNCRATSWRVKIQKGERKRGGGCVTRGNRTCRPRPEKTVAPAQRGRMIRWRRWRAIRRMEVAESDSARRGRKRAADLRTGPASKDLQEQARPKGSAVNSEERAVSGAGNRYRGGVADQAGQRRTSRAWGGGLKQLGLACPKGKAMWRWACTSEASGDQEGGGRQDPKNHQTGGGGGGCGGGGGWWGRLEGTKAQT